MLFSVQVNSCGFSYEEKKVNCKRLAGILVLILALFLRCSGNNANLKNQSEIESKATQQELLSNWSDYDIKYNTVVIVFDPKKDDKKILVNNYWGTVNDQETWTRLVNGSERLPGSWGTNRVWGNETREIWVNNEFYGYISHQPRELIRAEIVDENTVRISHHNSGDWRL